MFKNKWIKFAAFGVIGGLGGFAYYYFIGCTTNTCPITSNPFISTAYGFGVGILLGWDNKKPRNKDQKEEESSNS